MPDDLSPYTAFEAGQLITAEVFNELQRKIRADIAAQITTALDALTEIGKSKDSDQLGGETSQELLQRFLERAMEHFPGQTGYRKLFKSLRLDRPSLIKHELGACPLVDVYGLDTFDVVCAVDDDKHVSEVKFYLYHTSEKKIRNPENGDAIVIEPTDGPVFRIAWSKMLELLGVEYTPSTTLGDLETEFWTAMFAEPNDPFDPDHYCHSPWFERCCREERTVESLKEKGDWDELWLKMVPRKTISLAVREGVPPADQRAVPLPVNVAHLSLDTVGLAYLRADLLLPADSDIQPPDELCLMVLLKV